MKEQLDRIIQILARFMARIVSWFTAPADTWLKRLIKAAAVGISTPATIYVAGTLADKAPEFRLLAQVCGLVLVEGALLMGWNKLDERNPNKPLTEGQRNLYAAIAGVAYLVLWIVAILHGEGLAGIAFRATLGALLWHSMSEAGLVINLRLQRSASRDIQNHRKVNKYREQAEIRIARLEVDRWEQVEAQRIMPGYNRRQARGLLSVLFERPALAARIIDGAAKEPPIPDYKWTDKARQLVEVWRNNPNASNPEAGKLVGLSGERVRQIKAEMQTAGVVHVNGNGVEVING